MVLKAENTQILVKTGTAQAGQLEASNTNIPNSVVNGGEISAPTDTLNATGATTDVELKTKRSAGEVSQALDKISKQTGLNINKLLEIIEKMTGKSLTDLQNIEQNELTNITTGLGKILNDCKVNGVIDNSRLEKAINDYNIAIQTLWTLDGFYKQQQNVKKSTLTERLIETDCLDEALDPNAHDYEAKMEAAIEKFFEKTLLSRISPNTPQKNENKSTKHNYKHMVDYWLTLQTVATRSYLVQQLINYTEQILSQQLKLVCKLWKQKKLRLILLDILI